MRAKDKKKMLPDEATAEAGVNQSYDELLKWIADKPRNFGWGAVVSYDREQTNKVLAQQYIEKYSEDNFIKPLGTLVPDNDNKNATQIVDYTFDAPRLSFEGTTLLNGKANLTLGVVGGAQLYWTKDADGYWHISKVSELDVLDGQRLTSTVVLTDSNGGSVADNGTVSLDVSKGSDYKLAEMTTDRERERVGKALQEQLAIQPPKQTTFELGKVSPVDADPIIDPEYFKIAVYEKDPGTSIFSDDYGNGAVVLFIKMRGSKEPGTMPVETEQIGYLIPEGYTTSMLLNYNEVLKQGLVDVFSSMTDNASLDFKTEEKNTYGSYRLRLISSKINTGSEKLGGNFHDRFDDAFVNISYNMNWDKGDTYPDPHGMSNNDADEGMLEMLWGDNNEVKIGDVTLKGTHVGLWALSKGVDDNSCLTFKYSKNLATPKTLRLPYSFKHVNYQKLDFRVEEVNDHFKLDAIYERIEWDPSWSYKKFPGGNESYDYLRFDVFGDHGPTFLHFLDDNFYSYYRAVDKFFNLFKERVDNFVEKIELFRLNGLIFSNQDVVNLRNVHVPGDMFITGHIGERYDGFSVTPLEPVIGAGKTQQFSIAANDPTQFTVNWTLKSVTEGAEPGTIDANGLYTAPAADNVKSTGNRVIITATDDVNKFTSSALLTVVKRDLTVNPLLMECGASPSSYTVSAGAIDDGALSFSVENLRGDIPGTLTAKSTGEGYSYVAGTIGKDADGKAKRTNITLDRLTFTNAAGNKGESYALNILANLSDSLRIDYTKLGDIFDGTPIKSIPVMVVFQGLDGTVESRPGDEYWNDFEFEVVYGNGTFDKSKGEYTLADNSSERFAILKSFYLDGRSFTEGCLIIPLPLVNLPELVRFNMNIDAEVLRYTEMVDSASERKDIDNYVKGRVKRGRRVI